MKFLGLCQVSTCKASESGDCKKPDNDACYLKLTAYTEDASGTFHDKPIRSEVKFVYETGVETGVRYKDGGTGFEGVAISVHFYEHGCPRATLRRLNNGLVVEHTFDAPGLVRADEGQQAGFQVADDGRVERLQNGPAPMGALNAKLMRRV